MSAQTKSERRRNPKAESAEEAQERAEWLQFMRERTPHIAAVVAIYLLRGATIAWAWSRRNGLLALRLLWRGARLVWRWTRDLTRPAREWSQRAFLISLAWLWRLSRPVRAWLLRWILRPLWDGGGRPLWNALSKTARWVWGLTQPPLAWLWRRIAWPTLKYLWRKSVPWLEKLGRANAPEWLRIKSKPTLDWIWRKSAPLRKWIIRESEPRIRRARAYLRRRGAELWEYLNRISVRLYVGMSGVVLLTVVISFVAWLSFARVDDAQDNISRYIPEMATVFSITQQSNRLIDAATRLSAAPTREAFDLAREQLRDDQARYEASLNELLRREERNYLVDGIRVASEALLANLRVIERSVDNGFTLERRSRDRQRELTALRQLLERQLVEFVDDQFFYAVTGYRELGGARAARGEQFARVELHNFRYLTQLELASNLGVQLLQDAFRVTDPERLEPLQERFEGVETMVDWNLNNLGGPSALSPELWNGLQRLLEMGGGRASNFNLQRQALLLDAEQQRLLAVNRELGTRLGTVIQQTINLARSQSLSATHSAARTISDNRSRLLWITAVVLLIGWFYIGTLVERIRQVLNRMHRMAAGEELDDQVDISGGGEMAEITKALEGFRRGAQSAKRLGIVERMAEELRGKNEQLEKVLGELRQAQEQIVMREKLAGLGELTAGVAHEIKNPLNFVKNFSEGSIELLRELREIVDGKGRLDSEQLSSLADIGADLEENLASILRNGERANRIVHDMLSMGRDSGEFQDIDINLLVEEHANLAYHAARASDPEFQLTINKNLDPNAGRLQAIPHDLGRVFLNMVNNACYATDEKRKQVERDTGARLKAGEGYEPTVTLSTRRDGGRVIVSIHDNGTGIPKEMVDDVFNPFFTTKPPDKGTGLGLALSNDIVVKHGGAISLNTEAGKFTEMHVSLPTRPAAGGESEATAPPSTAAA